MYIIRCNEKFEIVYFAYFIPRTQHVLLTDYKTKIFVHNQISLYSATIMGGYILCFLNPIMMKIFVRGESCLMSSKIDFFLPAVDTLGYISLQRTNVKYLIAWSNTSETGSKIHFVSNFT